MLILPINTSFILVQEAETFVLKESPYFKEVWDYNPLPHVMAFAGYQPDTILVHTSLRVQWTNTLFWPSWETGWWEASKAWALLADCGSCRTEHLLTAPDVAKLRLCHSLVIAAVSCQITATRRVLTVRSGQSPRNTHLGNVIREGKNCHALHRSTAARLSRMSHRAWRRVALCLKHDSVRTDK